uniref:RT_RNaseH_2 domain-containing protein n=1 Tax=Trichuris muris TaxID=70415 RepID=A0A5S6QL91_TRIMR
MHFRGPRKLQFLGHIISTSGIRPTDEMVLAIKNVPVPKNKTELQAFLGLLNFYDRFLPNRANVLEPLYRLLKQHARWNWSEDADRAFREAKALLSSSSCLTLYDSRRPLVVTCDASSIGIGAVLAHVNADGDEQPVYFASRTLHQAERNYAQIDREALAIIFALQKFRRYLIDRKSTIHTDNRPLLGLLGQGKPIKDSVSPRMLRPGKQMGGADVPVTFIWSTVNLGDGQFVDVYFGGSSLVRQVSWATVNLGDGLFGDVDLIDSLLGRPFTLSTIEDHLEQGWGTFLLPRAVWMHIRRFADRMEWSGCKRR